MMTNRRPMGGPMRGGALEKARDFKGTWGRLLAYCKKYMPAVLTALLLAAAGTVLQIIGPDKLKEMTNEIMKGLPALVEGVPVQGAIDLQAVERIALLLTAFYAVSALLSFAQGFIMATVTQRISKNMRTGISKKINRLPLKYFDGVSHGEVLSRVTNDVDAIGQTMNQSVGSLVTSATLLIGSGVMMFYNNALLALTAIASSALGFLFMGVIMAKSQKYFVRQQEGLGAINGHVEEIYSGHNVVKAYNGGREARRVFEEINQKLHDSGWKSQFMSGLMMPLMTFIGNFGYVSVCVVGAALAMKGTISFGVIVAFMLYIRLFTQPLAQIAQAFQNLQRTAAASERVFAFFDEEELSDEREKTGRLTNVKGDVEFRHVKSAIRRIKPSYMTFPPAYGPGRKWPSWDPPARARPPWSTCSCASMSWTVGKYWWTACPKARCPGKMCTSSLAWCCRTPGSSRARSKKTSSIVKRA